MSQAPVWKVPVLPQKEEPSSLITKTSENRRILVVEDEVEITEAYRAILDIKAANVVPLRRSSRDIAVEPSPKRSTPALSFQLTVVTTASEALEAVQAAVSSGRPYAMGFFDVLLGPGMDGVELVRRIHAIDPEMYAVFVTAYNDRSVESINQLLGEDKADRWDYLNKPFSEGEIFQKARNATTYWNLSHEKRQRESELSSLRQALLEQEKMASIAALARSVGHEFGNILMQIMGRADLSLHGKPEQLKPAMEMILKAALTASKILDRFKNLARGAEQKVEKKDILLIEPIREALDLLQHQLDKMGVEVEVVDNLQCAVPANVFSLIQVFVNLAINSLQAMEESPRGIGIHLSREGDFAQVIFFDKGPGIPLELMDKISQPFFTTKEGTGTGLGLAICREIVEIEHAGRFLVGNHPQFGAQFTILLPLGKSLDEVEHE